MFNPKSDLVVSTVTRFSEKHKDDLSWVQLRFELLDLYDARYPDGLIQQLVPVLEIDFK